MQNKIFISGFLISALFVSGAMAAPTALTRTANGGYNVSYNYNDKPKTEWYGTIRAELNLLSWTNKYYTASVGSNQYDSDKYSMKPLFGGSLAVGKKFEGNWR
ncbi:MAG: hypothetical protein LBJ18_03885, partial [Rickettsiales bacterium]|nr:hypothetical protein [Rickettsiales bacterium]